MQMKFQFVCSSCWCMPRLCVARSSHYHWAGMFFCVQYVLMIMKNVTPGLAFLKSLVGKCTRNYILFHLTWHLAVYQMCSVPA